MIKDKIKTKLQTIYFDGYLCTVIKAGRTIKNKNKNKNRNIKKKTKSHRFYFQYKIGNFGLFERK